LSSRRRRDPLADRRRHYPGFFAAFFLVLLRIAIGWHFLYEGIAKYEMGRKGGGQPFSAEPYLRASTGPFARYFRGIVPDVNGLARLDPARLKAGWKEDVDKIAKHYRFDQEQRAAAATELQEAETEADDWFLDKTFQDDRRKYIVELAEVQKIERNPQAMSFERERAADRRKDLEGRRGQLLRNLDTIGIELRASVDKLATDGQRLAAGNYPGYVWTTLVIPTRESSYDTRIPIPDWDPLRWINFLTMYGLMAMGAALMLGLFTRPAALAGAVFLAQIYLSMPPWPGYPQPMSGPGHYMIVNVTLIEMLACLVLGFTPTGRWIGIDAFLFNWIGRRRRRAEAEPETQPTDDRDRNRSPRARTASQPRIK
jgi:uncharacterized membrane protein YphA (DoxX/SURF4 family)